MKLFFDPSRQGKWHRMEWERCLEEASVHQGTVSLAVSRQDADFVIVPETPQLTEPLSAVFRRVPADEFVWDYCDHPAGRHPGFYCSLARQLFDPARHRSFCYPITFNEQVREFDPSDASLLFSFVGGISSPLRHRLLQYLGEHPLRSKGFMKSQGGPWSAMFDRSGLEIKREFAESMRRARFILCPRGIGFGSIRLFEAMKARRVPVIISDGYVLPLGVDWDSCSIRVGEHNFEKIPEVLLEKEQGWDKMADSARREWEKYFGPANLLGEMGRHLEAIRSPDHGPTLRSTASLLVAVTKYRAKALYRKIPIWRMRSRISANA